MLENDENAILKNDIPLLNRFQKHFISIDPYVSNFKEEIKNAEASILHPLMKMKDILLKYDSKNSINLFKDLNFFFCSYHENIFDLAGYYFYEYKI